MKRQSSNLSIPTLRDAYQVAGFRVRARLTNLQGMTYRALVLTLERRSKKRCATDAAKRATGCTGYAGDGCAISVVGIVKSISTFPCAA